MSSEPDTLIKVVRDLFNSDITQLMVDGDDTYESLSGYVDSVAPELSERVSRYNGPKDVFAQYRIDEQIAKAVERKVHLPSGGSLVIDRTEAMTVIDVNTGKYTGSGGNLEETVTKNNLEAAEEIVRQLRLRDVGGIIVIDFIDMVLESNRELVLRRLTECLGRDRTRHQVAEVTSLGLVQMTRKKVGTGLVEAFSEPCPHCGGRGIVLHDLPVEQAGGTPDDTDRKNTRSRRGRGTQTAPAELAGWEPPKVAVPLVRPPDPRGPRAPSRSGQDGIDPSDRIADVDDPTFGADADGAAGWLTDAAIEPAVSGSADPAVVDARSPGVIAVQTAPEPVADRDERGFFTDQDGSVGDRALSKQASAAVDAVLAALDARLPSAAGDSAGGDAANSGAEARTDSEASTDTAAEQPPAVRRRGGRRASARPAGAPRTERAPDSDGSSPAVTTSAGTIVSTPSGPTSAPELPHHEVPEVVNDSAPNGARPDGSAPAAPAGADESNVGGDDQPDSRPAQRGRRRRVASRPAGPAGEAG